MTELEINAAAVNQLRECLLVLDNQERTLEAQLALIREHKANVRSTIQNLEGFEQGHYREYEKYVDRMWEASQKPLSFDDWWEQRKCAS